MKLNGNHLLMANILKLHKYQTFDTEIEMERFFSEVDIPKPSENQAKLCEEILTEKDLYNYLKSM